MKFSDNLVCNLQFLYTIVLSLTTVTYVQQVLDKIKDLQYGSLATVVGRYYAMDRDKRFERNKIAFEGMVQGIGETATPDTVIEVKIICYDIRSHFFNFVSKYAFLTQVIKKRYEAKGNACQTDEFLKPIIVDPDGHIQGILTLHYVLANRTCLSFVVADL